MRRCRHVPSGFGDETAGVTRRAIDDEVEVPLHELVLLETRERYLQIRVRSLCTPRCHCRQGPRKLRYEAGAPLIRTDLPPAGAHQLAWRTHSITSKHPA